MRKIILTAALLVAFPAMAQTPASGGGDTGASTVWEGSCTAIDARSAAACGPLIHGTVSTNVAGAPDANTTARPRCTISEAVAAEGFSTAPFGARLPFRTATPPDFASAFSAGRITSSLWFTTFFT